MTHCEPIILIAKEMMSCTLGDVQESKAVYICESLRRMGLEYEYKKDFGIMATLRGECNNLVIINHFDLIPLFKKNTREEAFTVSEHSISGALDNTIVNASLLYMIEKGKVPAGSTIFFSDCEESGFDGVKNFFKNGHHKKDNFYVNLDVTTQIGHESVAIEYDQWRTRPVKVIKNLLQGREGVIFHRNRFPDDLTPVLRLGGKGTSFCLVTTQTIHSYRCTTKKRHIEKYVDELEFFLPNMRF